MAVNVPKVMKESDYQKFFDAVKIIIDTLTGRNKKAPLDRVITVKDLEKLGIVPGSFLVCTKQNPYPGRAGKTVANTNTPSGATSSAWPIVDEEGKVIGYVPVYASQW